MTKRFVQLAAVAGVFVAGFASAQYPIMDIIQQDPGMRQAFFNQIAGPVMNKMFECGMIP
jgi:hypothetical protein